MRKNVVFVKMKGSICFINIAYSEGIFDNYEKYQCTYHDFLNKKELFIKSDLVVLYYEKKQEEYIKELERKINKIVKVYRICSEKNKNLNQCVVYYDYDKEIKGKVIINNQIFKGANGLSSKFDKTRVVNQNNIELYSTLGDLTTTNGLQKMIEKYSYLYRSNLFNEECVSFKKIYEEYKKNDLLAKKILSAVIEAIAQSAENIIHIIDPGLIIFNLNLGKYENEIIECIEQKVYKNMNGSLKTRFENFNIENKKYLMKVICANIYDN